MADVTQTDPIVEAPSHQSMPHRPTPYPRIVHMSMELKGEEWTLHFSADFQEVVSGESKAFSEQLEQLLVTASKEPFHKRVDFSSVLTSIVVNPKTHDMFIGSPQFWTERFLFKAYCDESAPDPTHWAEWKEHVSMYIDFGDKNGVPDIEQITATEGLFNLHTPLSELKDPDLKKELTSIEEHSRIYGRKLMSEQNKYRSGFMERITQIGFDLAANYSIFRVYMLRFIAMLPSLDFDLQGHEVKRLLRETLRRATQASRSARKTSKLRPLPRGLEALFFVGYTTLRFLPASWVAGATRSLVKRFARMLIAGQNIAEAQSTLNELAETGRDATLDQLGELVVSEPEADTYLNRVLILIRGFRDSAQFGTLNAANIPRPNVSVKMSALCAHFNPDDPDGTYNHVAPRVLQILRAAQENEVYINMDAEHYEYRDLNFLMLRRVLLENEDIKAFPWVGLAVQAYLRDASKHLDDIITLGHERGVVMPLRLVKGAYWDQETIEAEAHGYDAPQFLNKCETDIHFQQLCLKILQHSSTVQLCVGSHNLRDHCFARASREVLYPDAPIVEHQVLHMTSEPLAVAMAKLGWPVRNYIPVGSLLVGMAYLVRRIMENSSQVGVLTQARKGLDPQTALHRAADILESRKTQNTWISHESMHAQSEQTPSFVNVAPARLYVPSHRAALEAAILSQTADQRLLPIDNPHRTGGTSTCHSPSDPNDVIGTIENLGPDDVAPAIDRALNAHKAWSEQPASGRGACLVRAAELMRVRRMEGAILVARDGGKNRVEALADIDEAIDFLRFYACEALRLESESERQSRGVMAVIAPWNFPLAIACGMTSASLAAGNSVLLKPARQTALVGEYLVRTLHEAGVPNDVVQAVPGSGRVIGAALVHNPKVAGCVFTGSRAVGSWIYESMAHRIAPKVHPDRCALPAKVIAEMGGKNAIIVTANADLDEAVSGSLASTFAHAGQKCSAASRIFVDRRIMETFKSRFSQAALDLRIGPALEPGVDVNPVIAEHEASRLMEAVVEGNQECDQTKGTVLVDRSQEWLEKTGHIVGPTVFELDKTAYADMGCLARRELFGPVVHLIAYDTLQEAVDLFNDCEYALTGGIFAQSDDDIDWVKDRAQCGNFYVNRPITGARVSIEPFGGFLHSGTGPKAGGKEYLKSLWPEIAPIEQRVAPILLELPIPEPAQFDDCNALELVRPSNFIVDTKKSEARRTHLKSLLKRLRTQDIDPEARKSGELLLSWLEDGLASLVHGHTLNRTIPGQESYDQLNQRRGDVLLLSTGECISTHAILHTLAAIVLQNPVTVHALTPATISAWGRFAKQLDLHEFTLSEGNLTELAQNPRFATIIYDGIPEDLEKELQALLQFPLGSGELRRLYTLTEGPFPAQWKALCSSHLRTRSFAINTLRHGAPLSLG